MPRDRPLLLVVNHPNALVDALLVGWVVPRRVLITAKSTLFTNPIASRLLRWIGVLPLHRTSDAAGAGRALRSDAQSRHLSRRARRARAAAERADLSRRGIARRAVARAAQDRRRAHRAAGGSRPTPMTGRGRSASRSGHRADRTDVRAQGCSRARASSCRSVSRSRRRRLASHRPSVGGRGAHRRNRHATSRGDDNYREQRRRGAHRFASRPCSPRCSMHVPDVAHDWSVGFGAEATLARRIDELASATRSRPTPDCARAPTSSSERLEAVQHEAAQHGVLIEDVGISLAEQDAVCDSSCARGGCCSIGGPVALWGRDQPLAAVSRGARCRDAIGRERRGSGDADGARRRRTLRARQLSGADAGRRRSLVVRSIATALSREPADRRRHQFLLERADSSRRIVARGRISTSGETRAAAATGLGELDGAPRTMCSRSTRALEARDATRDAAVALRTALSARRREVGSAEVPVPGLSPHAGSRILERLELEASRRRCRSRRHTRAAARRSVETRCAMRPALPECRCSHRPPSMAWIIPSRRFSNSRNGGGAGIEARVTRAPGCRTTGRPRRRRRWPERRRAAVAHEQRAEVRIRLRDCVAVADQPVAVASDDDERIAVRPE